MNKFINNQKPFNIMKQFFNLFVVLLLSLMIGNSAIFNDNQDENFIKLGSNSIVTMINPAVLDNTTLSEAYKLILTTTDTYLVFTSQSGINESINFGFNDGTGWSINNYNVNVGENLYLALSPQVVDDSVDILISNPSGQIAYSIITFNDNERGLNDRVTIFAPFITGVTELIAINMSIWTIFYYVLIMLLIVGFIAGIVYGAYKWYQFTDKHNIYGKAKRSNYK